MRPVIIHDKEIIERYLRGNEALNIYCIGDLDDFFRPFTIWYALADGAGRIRALSMLYTGCDIPALMAYRAYEDGALAELISGISGILPANFYAHLCGPSEVSLAKRFELESHGRHLKMYLKDASNIPPDDNDPALRNLGAHDLEALLKLYDQSYPGNWFDPVTLVTGQYFGIFEGAELVCAAGVHVFSPAYGAAALGNITTLPRCRGKGLAAKVTAALCRSLMKKVRLIGLNVDSGNAPAIRCYEKLGFVVAGEYGEFMARSHPPVNF